MSMSKDSVINTLITALEANPGDTEMRLHVAEMMLTNGDYESAATNFSIVLQNQPANISALKGASAAATQLGDDSKAEGYKQLLTALGTSVEPNTDTKNSTAIPTNIAGFTGNTLSSASKEEPGEKPVKLKSVGESENVTIGPWEDFEAPITLDDVGGMSDVKKRLNMAFLAPLKNPEIMKMYGKSLKGGLLLYGPPGCGKTFIARALAGELGATFISVGLSDVLDMWLGESERKLYEIFETARRKAPTVLFFDEIDALGQKRSQMKNTGGRTIVNQLLAEMDSDVV